VDIQDPKFWRAGAISSTVVMLIVLAFLTIDSLETIRAGGRQVPNCDVINQRIGYAYDWSRRLDVPVIGPTERLFGKSYSLAEATAQIRLGKLSSRQHQFSVGRR
jgi:nitric oxide reductase subunit C